MAALDAGTSAPDFTLPATDGTQFSLREALQKGPVIAAFFKVSCPVCQYAFPFLERIHKSQGNKNVTIVGISQNDKRDTEAFMKEYGITFPVLLDDTRTYPVSNAYGITNVPTTFYVAPHGTIEVSSVSWAKKEMDQINRMAAEANGAKLTPIFRPSEQVADFRAG
ncbi:MAG TPA: TlpA disulfide reductase family protein [Terriglobales bacterium]|nr:TlpA disulfide reductase family protein [Terriglobales bacterium]